MWTSHATDADNKFSATQSCSLSELTVSEAALKERSYISLKMNRIKRHSYFNYSQSLNKWKALTNFNCFLSLQYNDLYFIKAILHDPNHFMKQKFKEILTTLIIRCICTLVLTRVFVRSMSELNSCLNTSNFYILSAANILDCWEILSRCVLKQRKHQKNIIHKLYNQHKQFPLMDCPNLKIGTQSWH